MTDDLARTFPSADDMPGAQAPVRLSERKRMRVAGMLARPRKPVEQYSGFSEYFAAEVEPGLRAQPDPPVRLGYPHLKRRR